MWRCFLIEEAHPRVEYLTIHDVEAGGFHRCVVAVLEGVEFDDADKTPPDGYPDSCSQCGRALDWRDYSRMGTHSWRSVETDEVMPNLEDHGVGAMFDKTEWSVHQAPDGKSWGVVLPPGGQVDVWGIDEQASSGGYWTRTGAPPLLLVTPSILTPNYHGFLGSNGAPVGYLSDDLEGRIY